MNILCLLLFLNILFPSELLSQWTHLSGNQTKNTPTYINTQSPGGLYHHTMAIDNDFIYIFGGEGYSGLDFGIVRYLSYLRFFQ